MSQSKRPKDKNPPKKLLAQRILYLYHFRKVLHMKKNLLQFLFLPLAGLLTLALLALTVLSCIPQKEATLRETEDVALTSSAADQAL